jgi:hypothetical protein
MPTYRERSADAEDPVLIARVRNGLVKFVIYKFGTSATDAEKRLGLQILANPEAFARTFAIGVTANDFWRSGNAANDPEPDNATGDTKLQSIIEATLWPIYITEAP